MDLCMCISFSFHLFCFLKLYCFALFFQAKKQNTCNIKEHETRSKKENKCNNDEHGHVHFFSSSFFLFVFPSFPLFFHFILLLCFSMDCADLLLFFPFFLHFSRFLVDSQTKRQSGDHKLIRVPVMGGLAHEKMSSFGDDSLGSETISNVHN